MDLYFNYIDGINFLIDSPHLIPMAQSDPGCAKKFDMSSSWLVTASPGSSTLVRKNGGFTVGFRQEKGLNSGSIIVVNNELIMVNSG